VTNHFDARPSPEPDLPSRELASRAARGDARALTEFVRATSQQVWRTCAFLVDRASADDLTQETYLRAVRSLPAYRGEAEPVRWLLTIARRACADEIARRQRGRAITARAHAAYRISTIEPSLDVELADAIARLPPERREAFLLTAIAGFSYAEAASLCACPIGTIRSRVARARAELIAGLEAPMPERWDKAQ
jgi:RNA polymerase sigma-70 factor (ECF subfamily)